MVMTAFSCSDCGTRVEAAICSAVLHCPVCANVLDEEVAATEFEPADHDEEESFTGVREPQPDVTPDGETETAQGVEQELKEIEEEWQQYQQTHLYRPRRGTERVPSKRWAVVRLVCFALPLVVSLYLLVTGQLLFAALVFVFAGYGVYRAATEYIMAENRDVAALVYETKRNSVLSRIPTQDGSGRHSDERSLANGAAGDTHSAYS